MLCKSFSIKIRYILSGKCDCGLQEEGACINERKVCAKAAAHRHGEFSGDPDRGMLLRG